MSRRRFVLGATLTLAFAAGCTNSDTAEDGDAITVFGPYRGAEADRLAESLEVFSDATGIPVRYTGSTDFVSDLERRLDDGADPPDIAVVPQPGLIEQLAADASILPLEPATSAELDENYRQAVRDVVRFDGTDYGVPFRRTVKSVVWFRADVFEVEQWEVPATLDDLEDLAATIAESDRGISPWCFGLDAGDATGWAATDWVEDLVVRRHGAEVYDDWARGEIEFADPRIRSAFEEFRTLVLARGRVIGGERGVLATRVDRAWEPLLDSDPGCAMYRQADFAIGWMPEGTEVGDGADLDWFVLSGESADTAPLVVGGDAFVRFTDRSEVGDLMTFLATADAGEPWVRAGGFLTAKSTFDSDRFPVVERRFVRAAADAPVQVFDASDAMHPEIGVDLLWSEITRWVSGATSYGDFAETIDAARAEFAS